MSADHPIEKWSQLRTSSGGDGLMEVPSISTGIETGYGAVRYGIGPNGEPRLLVPVGPDARASVCESGGKLCVRLARFHVQGRPASFLDITCLDRGLDSVFAEIADEVLHRISGGIAPVVAVITTIDDFRSLLSKAASEIDSMRVVGLIGELVLLEQLSLYSPKAIDSWTGPEGQRHDFRKRDKAIEVKTSVRASATSVQVSSIEQMAPPVGGSLILAHVVVERSAGGELSVRRIVDRLLGIGVSRDELERRLNMLGCSDPESSGWNRYVFQLESLSFYSVRPGFPRMIPECFVGGSLPVGVVNIGYSIDLSCASDFLIPGAESELSLRDFLS